MDLQEILHLWNDGVQRGAQHVFLHKMMASRIQLNYMFENVCIEPHIMGMTCTS